MLHHTFLSSSYFVVRFSTGGIAGNPGGCSISTNGLILYLDARTLLLNNG